MDKLLYSTNNKPIYGKLGRPVYSDFVSEWLYFEYTFLSPTINDGIMGRIVYDYSDITGGTPNTPTQSRWAYQVHSSDDNVPGTSTLTLKTRIDYIESNAHGGWAHGDGVWTYQSLNWRIKNLYKGEFLSYNGVSAFTLRTYIGSLSQSKNCSGLPEWTYDSDDGFIAGGAFPSPSIIAATITWTPATKTLSIE